MTRHIRQWIAAVAVIATTGLTAELAVTATAGVNQTHTIPVAGITLNAID